MKKLYFIGEGAKSLIDQGIQERVTALGSGLRAFVRNNKDCVVDFRVAQEAVHFVAPQMTKRKIIATVQDFKKCLAAGALNLEMFSEEFAQQARGLIMGSFVICLEGFEDDYIKKLVLTMWRCRKDAINCLINQIEIDGMKSKMRSLGETFDDPAKGEEPLKEVDAIKED
jgi:hypothetical protein